MRRVHRLLLAGLPLVWAGLSAPDAHACSLADFKTVRGSKLAHFIATATADTLFTGPGTMRYQVQEGHFGPAGDRTIYGQVVDVERAGGLALARIPGRFTRAVVPRHQHGADCRTTPYTRTARWVQPGTRGLFVAVLRDSAHWVDGIPTFDVGTPDTEPYPQRAQAWKYGGDDEKDYAFDSDSILTMDQAFALMDVLPVLGEKGETEDARPLFAWARANPRLARRYPAAQILRFARLDLEYDLLGKIDPPLAGTYRFTATLAGRPPVTFFVRTRSAPTNEWDPRPAPPRPQDPTEVRRPHGYNLLAAGAPTADALPVDVESARRMDREGYFSLLTEPERMADGTQVWRGSIEINLVARQFPADSAIGQFARGDFQRSYEAYEKELPDDMPARFVLAADGSVRGEQTTDLGGGRVLTIRAERISRDVIPNPRR
jgi:hypothetical protein